MKKQGLSCDLKQSMKTCLWTSKLTMCPFPPDDILRNGFSSNIRDTMMFGSTMGIQSAGMPEKSQLSWFRWPLFCFGGGEDGAENKLLKGYFPIYSLSVLHTPSSATLLAGWGMGWKGAQQNNRGLGGGESSDRSISFSINQEAAGSFLSTSSGGHSVTMRLGDSTDSFVSQDVNTEEEERAHFAPKLPFLTPQKLMNITHMVFYNQIIQTSFDLMVGLTTPQHQSLHNRMAFLIWSNSPLTLIIQNHFTLL